MCCNYSTPGQMLPCNCDGCELDSKPLVSEPKNPYWFKFRQIVPIDLITKFVGTIFMTTDVATGEFCYSVRKKSDMICDVNSFVYCFLEKKTKKQKKQVTTLRHKSYFLWQTNRTCLIDIQTGCEHWQNGHFWWAITTWILMFLPATISLLMEIVLSRCKVEFVKGWVSKMFKFVDT